MAHYYSAAASRAAAPACNIQNNRTRCVRPTSIHALLSLPAGRGSQPAPPPPSSLRRCRRHCAVRPAALFGFGKPAAPATERKPAAPAPDTTSPVLIPYTPIQKKDDYTLRLFNAYTVAEAAYRRRDEGFLQLGSYMSGSNASGVRCRETQPIVMCYPPEGPKLMQVYVVPRTSSSSSGSDDATSSSSTAAGSSSSSSGASSLPPAPTDPAVSLSIAGGELVAARQFEGNATQEACEACRRQLLAALERDGVQLAEAEAGGYFRLAQYGPLHSLSTRLNEIWLAVKLG